LFYNDLIYQDNNITIPHKGIVERDFVLVPLYDIEPEMIHPGNGYSVSEIKIPQKESNIINKIPTDLHNKWIKQKAIPI
jgi:2-amino-4-hydroxy-6-hydroxymethyldihydropteridine diphosphokinase